MLLGGRASEEIIFKEITTGAHNDLQVATETARRMVCEFGMSENLGHLTFGRKNHQVFLGRDITEERNYSDQTAELIDKEVRSIVDSAYNHARDLLKDNKEKLINLADVLLEKEVLSVKEAREAAGLHEPVVEETGPDKTTKPKSALPEDKTAKKDGKQARKDIKDAKKDPDSSQV